MKPPELEEERGDEPLDQLERRLAEIQLRLTTEINALRDEIRVLKAAVVADLRRAVADHEERIRKLEAKRP
jgi:hypothetical protein